MDNIVCLCDECSTTEFCVHESAVGEYTNRTQLLEEWVEPASLPGVCATGGARAPKSEAACLCARLPAGGAEQQVSECLRVLGPGSGCSVWTLRLAFLRAGSSGPSQAQKPSLSSGCSAHSLNFVKKKTRES